MCFPRRNPQNPPDSQNPRKETPSFDPKRPIVCFGAFQDYLGYNRETGGIKPKTSGFMRSIGILSFSTSITSGPGRRTPS